MKILSIIFACFDDLMHEKFTNLRWWFNLAWFFFSDNKLESFKNVFETLSWGIWLGIQSLND